MKKNQILQLLLMLQLIVVVVLGVGFWDRLSNNNNSSVNNSCPNNNCSQVNSCSSGTCGTCSTCQTNQALQVPQCSNCSVVPQLTLDSQLQDDIQVAVDRTLRTSLQDLDNSYLANSEEIQLAVNNAVGAALQTLDTGYIANSEEVQAAINTAIGSALQNFEDRYITTREEIQVAVNTALESALTDLENSGVFLGGSADIQDSRAYDPNAEAALTVPVTNTAQAPEVPQDVDTTSVPETVKALAAEQTDDFDSLASRTSNFRSTESSFETSSDILFEGSALKFKPETSEDVLTVFRGGAVDDDGVFIFKRFGEDHTILAVNSPPSTAPFYGKESTVALVRGDEPNVEVVDFYNQDYPEAGVRQAGIRVIKEVGPDVTKSEWLPFAIDFAAHSTETKETTEYEVLKITPPSPQANVQVNGYLQIDVVNEPGSPPIEDCNAIEEHGRMKVDAREGVSLLYICTSDGWVAK